MFKKWIDEHFKLFGVLLLVLAALNGWAAYRIFANYPVMALVNGLMAVVIALGVILLWGAGGPK